MRAALLAIALCSCSSEASAPAAEGGFVLRGGVLAGGQRADVHVVDGRIVAVGEVDAEADAVDVEGRFLAPAFVDSHVHLAYRPDVDGFARGGVAAVVDLAAPLGSLEVDVAPLRIIASGPMVTAVGGYPTRSWGADGYGVECAGASEAVAAVEALHAAGARVIKLPITSGAVLDEPALAAAADRAHALGLKVAVHALSDDEAARAARIGADVLAHTPTQPLSADTVEAWRERAVIGTLRAFGSAAAVDNLRALRAAGATVLYGTDFGNTTTAGIDEAELRRMLDAGLDGAAVLASGTSAPAAYWGLDDLGALAPGQAASFLVLRGDPLDDPLTLADPVAVYLDGAQVR